MDSEFENILRNNPYTEQDKIDELFSHLVVLDEIKKHRNIEEKNLITKNIDFSISYAEKGFLETGKESKNKLEEIHKEK